MGTIKLQEPNEKVVLCVKSADGRIVPLDISEKALMERVGVFGTLKGYPTPNVWNIKRPCREPFPEGVVLEDCHIHDVREGLFGGLSVSVSWTSERPLTVKYYKMEK